MIWQDIIITIANLIFAVSIIIQVYHGYKEKTEPIKYMTSIPTFFGLYLMSLAFWSLNLYFSTAVAFLSGTLWLLLFVQRLIYNK